MDYSSSGNAKRKRAQRSSIKRVKNKVSLLIFRTAAAIILIAGFALAGATIGAYLGILKNSPTLSLVNIQPDVYTSFILDSKTGEVIDALNGEENRVYVTFDRMPDNLKNAFIAIEDERFYSHNGVDFRGMARALYKLVLSMGETSEGASTITQQVIKHNLGKSTNTLISKLQEQYLAVQFEKKLAEPENFGSKEAAKNYILEVYMNIINLGRGYYGVQTAANNYYGKDVSELTLSECATIAAITQNPSKYPPDLRPENNRYRQALVLDNMLRLGFITEAEHQAAMDDPVYDRVVTGAMGIDGEGIVHSYFTDALITQILSDLQAQYNISKIEAYNWIYNKGLQIYSTQDLSMQAIVDEVMCDDSYFPAADFEIDVEYILSVKNNITGKITNHNKKKTVKKWEDVDVFVTAMQNELLTANDDVLGERVITTPQPQACFIIIDYYTGQVKALSGGRGEKPVNLSFNRAIGATRSPGSQFKVVASYAPALDLGRITAATVIDDVPYTYDDGKSPAYTPVNWWGSAYEGLANVRRGIYRSMNLLAVQNLVNTGIDTGFAYLQNFGFTTLVEGETRSNGRFYTDKGPSLSLGGMTDGVKAIELAAAYGTIANLGEYNKPILYTKVLDHDGNILLENVMEPRRVLKQSTAYVLTDMMRDVVRVGTGTKAALKNTSLPVAGKTGTSTDTKDLGFTGYTPYYVATVWMGFDQQKKISGSNANHLQIWSAIMDRVHENLPEKEFERPDGITTMTVCRDSGMLPTELCTRDPRGNRTYRELFIAGTQPTEYCEVHQELRIDTVTNMRANPYCPYDIVETRVGIVRSIPYEGSAYVADKQYEFSADLVHGPECIYHSPGGSSWFDNNPWIGGLPDVNSQEEAAPENDIDNWWQAFLTPTPIPQPEFPWSSVPESEIDTQGLPGQTNDGETP